MEEIEIVKSIRKVKPTVKIVGIIVFIEFLVVTVGIPVITAIFDNITFGDFVLREIFVYVPEWAFTDWGAGYAALILTGLLGFTFIFFWAFSKCELVVTNKRIVGRSTFRRTIDIPVDSISAVGTGMMSSIVVSSSSGKIRFSLLKNNTEIYKQISNLIIARQTNVVNERVNGDDSANPKQNIADELRQFKALLDEGLITMDEYEAKKQKLLNK